MIDVALGIAIVETTMMGQSPSKTTMMVMMAEAIAEVKRMMMTTTLLGDMATTRVGANIESTNYVM